MKSKRERGNTSRERYANRATKGRRENRNQGNNIQKKNTGKKKKKKIYESNTTKTNENAGRS